MMSSPMMKAWKEVDQAYADGILLLYLNKAPNNGVLFYIMIVFDERPTRMLHNSYVMRQM